MDIVGIFCQHITRYHPCRFGAGCEAASAAFALSLNDAYQDRCDMAVMISNDSDLAEAVRFVKESFTSQGVGSFHSHGRIPIRPQEEGDSTIGISTVGIATESSGGGVSISPAKACSFIPDSPQQCTVAWDLALCWPLLLTPAAGLCAIRARSKNR